MNNYRSRLINFAEVLLPAYRKGEVLETYDPTRETWWPIDPARDAAYFSHYLVDDFDSKEFWDLRIAPKPEPKIPDVPVFWIRYGAEDTTHRLVVLIADGMLHYHPSRGSGDCSNKLSLGSAAQKWHWTHDRKNWFDFYGRAVK